MERREFLITAAAGAAGVVGLSRVIGAQGRGGPPIDWNADWGMPAKADPRKLARLSMLTLNFTPIIKLPNPRNAGASPNPNAPSPSKMIDPLDLAQMYQDVFGIPNIEYQHSHIPSTEVSYLKDLRAHIEKAKSRVQQINLEIGPMFVSAADPELRTKCIEVTKQWVDNAVVLNCPKVMVNQGQPSQENKNDTVVALKTIGDYAKSKGVKISMETRGSGGGGRRAAVPGEPPPAQPMPRVPSGQPAWVLLKEIIEKSGTYSNIDIGGVGAANQDALHEAAKALLPTNSGQSHIKVSPNWDLPTFIKFYEGIGYKGLYTIEVTGFDRIRPVYNTILENI